MARLFTAGAETGDYEWNGATTGAVIYIPSATTTQKRTGDYSYLCQSLGQAIAATFRQTFDDNQTELYGRFALRVDTSMSDRTVRILSFSDDDNNMQLALYFNPGTSCLDWYNGSGTLLASGQVLVPIDTWVVCEFYIKCATSGTLTLKVNGTTAASYSGDTDPYNTGNIRSVTFGLTALTGAASGEIKIYFDDIAINNTDGSYQNSWIGLGGVFYLEPTANGDQNDWTPSAGTVQYQMVDDIPPDDATTFNQGSGSGAIELYEVDDCPLYIDVINLVEVVYRAALVTSGYNELTDLVKVSGTVYQGTEHTIVPITPSFTYYKGTAHYLNPATGSAWGTAEVNAAQAGVEITV